MLSKEKTDFLQKLSHFICKNALWIVLGFTAATAAISPLAAKLPLRANFLDLLPPEHPSIVNLNELMKHVGGTSFVIGVIESPDEKTAVEVSRRYSEIAAGFQQVEYIDNRTDVPAFANRKLLFLDLPSVKKLKTNIEDLMGYYRRKANPFYVDLLGEKEPRVDQGLELEEKVSRIGGFSTKEKAMYMQVVLLKPKHPLSDFTKTEQLIEESRVAFEKLKKDFKEPVTLGLTGPYRTRYEEYKTIKRDLQRTGLIAMVLLVLVNLIAFRNLRSLIYAYLPLAMGTIWIWAFTEISIGYLNLITAFLAAILFGMGGDYTFHILVSFEEDLRLTGDPEKAVQMTFVELWKPLWSSMWTTAVVFYAMIISDFNGFRHFGIIAGIGIVISFVIVLFVQPALIILIEKYFPAKRRPLGKGFEISKPLIYSIIIAGAAFTIFSATQVPKATFSTNFMDLQAKDDDSIALAERIGANFGVQLTPAVFMMKDRASAAELTHKLNQYIKETPGTTFDFAASVISHVPRDQEAKIAALGELSTVIDKYKALIPKLDPETRKKVENLQSELKPTTFTDKDLPERMIEQYEGKERLISTVFLYPNVRILDGGKAKKFIAEARRFPVPPEVKIAGEPLIYVDILNLIEKDTPVALGISTFVVFLLVLIHFRRLDHALWVHAPLAIGCLWMIGMMGIAGLKFNFFNLVIMPSILGVGIDNGIYIFDRYRERESENFFETMRKSLKGVLLSSSTNICAFGSIMLTSHQGMASMGKLGFFGFLGCLLASVIFVPALIELFELKYAHLFRRDKENTPS